MGIKEAYEAYKAEGWHRMYMCEASFKAGYESAQESMKDDPEADATDFAHPAWWRGHDHACTKLGRDINNILDGIQSTNVGTSTEPWQSLRQRLYDIRTLLGIAERIISQVEYDHNSKFYLNISQWYKVRRDYEQRMQCLRAASLAKEERG